MFKKFFLVTLLFSSFSWAQQYEYEGKWTQNTIHREGFELESSVQFQQKLQADVFRKFWDLRWTPANIPSAECQMIPGNGNGDWKGYWTAATSEQKMASLANAILGIGKAAAQQIVNDGYLQTKPQTWEAFVQEIRRADNQPDSLGYSREVIDVYGEQNKKNLGYVDRSPNINGGGNWEGYWDSGYSDRPYRLARAVRGLEIEDARQIVRSGYMDTIPKDWREFANRMILADRQLNRGFSSKVLSQYGQENMSNLGYFDAAACSWGRIYVQVLTNTLVTEFDHSEEKVFNVELKNSILLKGEEENIQLQFNGLEDKVNVTGAFSSYNVKRYENGRRSVNYVITATRLKKAPLNIVKVEPSNENGVMVASITDLGFKPELSDTLGDLVVTMQVYQKKFFSDKLMGTFEARLTPDGKTQKFSTRFAPQEGKKGYIRYSIKRVNSDYYSSEASRALETEDVRF